MPRYDKKHAAPFQVTLLDSKFRAITVRDAIFSVRSHQVREECEIRESISINPRRIGSGKHYMPGIPRSMGSRNSQG